MAARTYTPVKKLSDTFTTSSGKTMTRRQLSNLVARANYRVSQSRKYLSSKEYQNYKDQHEAGVQATGAYPEGQGVLTLKGITDPRKLRAIEKQARRVLQSHYASKKKYQATQKKRYETFKEKGLVKNEEEFDLLMDLFRSRAWQKATENEIISSEQLLRMLQDEIFMPNDEIFPEGAAHSETISALQEIIKKYVDGTETPPKQPPSAGSHTYKKPGMKKPGLSKAAAKALRPEEMDDEDIAEAIIDELIEVLKSR